MAIVHFYGPGKDRRRVLDEFNTGA
jgi:hypothetical protein